MTNENKLPVSREQFKKILATQNTFKGDKEHLYHFIQGAKHWNEWINQKRNNKGIRIDLRGLDLQSPDAIFYSCLYTIDNNGDFGPPKLHGYDLINIDLSHSQLDGVDFSNAHLCDTLMNYCSLEKTKFNKIKCENSSFNNSNLSNSNFDSAKINNTNFVKTTWKHAILSYIVFNEENNDSNGFTNFKNSTFFKCDFTSSTFHNTNFSGAIFEESMLFETWFHYCDLQEAVFKKINSSKLSFKGSDLALCTIDNCEFYEVDLRNTVLGKVYKKNNEKSASFYQSKLLKIELNKFTSCINTFFENTSLSLNDNCDEEVAIKVLAKGVVTNIQFVNPVFGRKVRDEAWLNAWRKDIDNKEPVEFKIFTILNKTWHWLRRPISYYVMKVLQFFWWISSNYGRSIVRWAMWCFAFVFLFGCLFNYLGTDNLYVNDAILDKNLCTYMYYSIVTFTTLGFGDITPITNKGMFYVVCEVVLGYVMLGGLISILANKLARRND